MKKIAEILGRESRRVTLLLPYDKAGIADTLRREAAVLSVEYGEDGVTVEAVVKPELWGLVRGYVQEGEWTARARKKARFGYSEPGLFAL